METSGHNLWHILIHNSQKISMFAVGAAIALHETFISPGERPFLLALAGGLMGLPFVITADKRRGGREEG